ERVGFFPQRMGEALRRVAMAAEECVGDRQLKPQGGPSRIVGRALKGQKFLLELAQTLFELTGRVLRARRAKRRDATEGLRRRFLLFRGRLGRLGFLRRS